jgi:hypothetical protein
MGIVGELIEQWIAAMMARMVDRQHRMVSVWNLISHA